MVASPINTTTGVDVVVDGDGPDTVVNTKATVPAPCVVVEVAVTNGFGVPPPRVVVEVEVTDGSGVSGINTADGATDGVAVGEAVGTPLGDT